MVRYVWCDVIYLLQLVIVHTLAHSLEGTEGIDRLEWGRATKPSLRRLLQAVV